jgi:hypothetical protein
VRDAGILQVPQRLLQPFRSRIKDMVVCQGHTVYASPFQHRQQPEVAVEGWIFWVVERVLEDRVLEVCQREVGAAEVLSHLAALPLALGRELVN